MNDWKRWETAPKDGSTILCCDTFGVMWARWHGTPTYEDFKLICGGECGKSEYTSWVNDLRSDPVEYIDEWEFGIFSHEECIENCEPVSWMHLPVAGSEKRGTA